MKIITDTLSLGELERMAASSINLRPSRGNKTRGVDDMLLREKIAAIVNKRIAR